MQMIDLMNIVREVVKDELARANKEYPQFCSRHEGLAVLEEELWETENDLEMTKHNFESIKELVFRDRSTDSLRAELARAEHTSLLMACEAIQVSAMCKKFKSYLEGEK